MKIAALDIVTNEETPIPPGQHVTFGEGDNTITVSVRDGVVEISADRRLVIHPRTANVIHVAATR